MNVQFKKGALELCVLTLLRQGEKYGYELAEAISGEISISEGTIYPILRRLRNEGYFEVTLRESPEGPPRKYYRLTQKGIQTQEALYAEWMEFSQQVNHLIGGSNMTRNDFLNALYRALLYLPAKERQEIMQDYEEHFAAGLEQGKTEEEICRALGDPGEIAQTYLQQSKAGEDGAYQASSAAPRSPAGEATAPIRPCPPVVSDNGNRVLYTVLFILDMIFFALPGIPGGFALAAAGAAILITSVAAGIFASSALLALCFISLSIALISAGVLAILLIIWSLRACYQRMR